MKLAQVAYTVLILIGTVIALCVLSHLYVSYKRMAAKKRLANAYRRESLDPEEIRQDLTFFRGLLQRVHPDQIATFPLGDIEQEMEELASSIRQPLTRLEFYRRFAPVVSLLDDEHTKVPMPEYDLGQHYGAGGKLFPFDVQFVDERLYIAGNSSDEKGIRAGMEIVSVNGIPADELSTTLMLYYSGTRDAQKLFYLQEHFRDALFLVYGLSDSFELALRDPETDMKSSYRVPGKAFKMTEPSAFYYDIVDGNTILFTYNAFEDKDNTFERFLKEMFVTAQEQSVQNLIVDLRRNQGGATALGDKLLAYLTDKPFQQFSVAEVLVSKEARAGLLDGAPGFVRWFPIQYFHPWLKPLWAADEGEVAPVSFDPIVPEESELRFDGEVYVLIGPGVMSSASLLAATVQTCEIGTLVGKRSGGFPTLYGNELSFHLPNTGLEIVVPCSVIYGNGTGPVVPDITVTQTVPDLSEHKDTVLEFTRELIQSTRPRRTVCPGVPE